MKRRSCYSVIQRMLLHVPENETEFIKDLKWNLDDSIFKAPEDTIQWERTMKTLIKHIPSPKEEWHFKVLSIFTTKSIEQLKKEVNPQ